MKTKTEMEHPDENKDSRKAVILAKIKSLLPEIIGVIVGGIAGYIYYSQIGCAGGSCAITSNPWLTVLWGGVLGYLIGGMLKPRKAKKEV